MIFLLIKVFFSTLLISFCFSQNILGQYKWTVVGRVVDTTGKPVPYARILIFPPEPSGGWKTQDELITDEQSDGDGNFSYRRQGTAYIDGANILYVTSPYPQNVFTPGNLFPPGVFFRGHPIEIKNNEELDIGDVPIQVYYGTLLIKLRNRKGNLLFRSAEDWEYIGLRIRNAQGIIVEETNVSPSNVRRAVRVTDSAIAIMLPEGVWQVEIAPDGLKQKWPFKLKGKLLKSDRLDIKKDKDLEIVLSSKK